MNSNGLTRYCLSKPGAYEDRPFGPDVLVIKVGSKIFALISNRDGKTNISLKCDPFLVGSLRQQYPAVMPGYHLNKEHWNTVVLDGTVPVNEVEWMIDHSYGLVFKGLTKSEKQVVLEKK